MGGIKAGHVFASQREACKAIGIEYKNSTNSRRACEKEFDRRWKWHKEGRKIIVDEVYPEIREKIDNRGKSEGSRGNNEGIYAKYSTPLLFEYLKNYKTNNGATLYCTTNQLAERIGAINCNYTTANNNREKYNQYMYNKNKFMNYTAKKDIFDALHEIIKPCIVGTLEKLQENKHIIYWQTYLIFYKDEEEGKKTITDVRISKDEETSIIRDIEVKVLESMGLENTKALQYNNKLQKEYYGKVNELVKLEIEMEFYCTGYKIIILFEEVIEENKNIPELKTKLNNIIFERAMKKINRKKDKVEKELDGYLGLPNPFWKKWDKDRLNGKYILEAEEMIKSLVKISYRDIRDVILHTKDSKNAKNEKDNKGLIKTFYTDEFELPY